METNKHLIVLVGLPRAGKSTWCKEQYCPVISLDAIRKATYGRRFWAYGEDRIWADAKHMVKTLFYSGHNKLIVDDTHFTRQQRDYWRRRLRHNIDLPGTRRPEPELQWNTYFHHIDTPPSICIERAIETNQEDLIPVIESVAEQFEPLQDDEVLWEDVVEEITYDIFGDDTGFDALSKAITDV